MNLEFKLSELVSILNASLSDQLVEDVPISNLSIDSRSPWLNQETVFVAVKGEIHDGHDYLPKVAEKGVRIAIVEKPQENTNLIQLIVPNCLKALQKIAKTHREKYDIPVIAVTGSNGKTIVKEWLYYALKDKFNIVRSPKSYNSQLGVPLSVLQLNKNHELAIFEAGISRPGEMELLEEIIQPTYGVFTGIGDAHQINFNSLEEKKTEKFKLFNKCQRTFLPNEKVFDNIDVNFESSSEKSNASLVYQIGKYLKIEEQTLIKSLKTLPHVSMRLEKQIGIDGALIINDTYSADLIGFLNALKVLENDSTHDRKIVILSNFEESILNAMEVGEAMKSTKVDQLIYIASEPVDFNLEHQLYFASLADFFEAKVDLSEAAILIKGSRKSGFEKIVEQLVAKKHVSHLEINLTALKNNFLHYRSKIKPEVRLLTMVKARAYGGGLVQIANYLKTIGADYFGVAYPDEGVKLRQNGINDEILVMNSERTAFANIVDYRLEPSIFSLHQLNEFTEFLILRGVKNYPIHIKLDTGMNRLGFREKDVKELISFLNTQPEVQVKSVFSHFAASDLEHETEFTFGQIRKFEILTTQIKREIGYGFIRHIANTSGIINYPGAHFDMVRLGIGLFGVYPKEYLRNTVNFYSEISQIKEVSEGESIGYSRSYIATEDMTIAIVPVGYADGIRRALSNGKWEVLIQNEKCPIVGNVCMDMIMVKLPHNDFSVGDQVEIFGDRLSILEMAQKMHTIPYEIISGISNRVARVYIEE